MRRRGVVGTVAGSMVLAAVLAILASRGAAPYDAAEANAARQAYEQAIVAHQQLALPLSRSSGVTRAAVVADSRARLGRLLTGAALLREEAALDSAIAGPSDPTARVFAGGADHFAYQRIETPDRSTVVITGSATTWSRVGQVRPTDRRLVTVRPSNVIDVHARVTLGSDGRWRVSSMDWSFAPGSAP